MSANTLVVIVMESKNLSPWQANQVGIPQFESCGLDVLVFDAAPLARRKVPAGDLQELVARLDAAPHVIILSYYDLGTDQMRPLAQILEPRGIPWTFVQTGIIPAPIPPRDLHERVSFAMFQARRVWRKLGFRGAFLAILEKARARIFRGNVAAYNPRYALVDGLKSEAAVSGRGAIIIPSHSRDHENKLTRGIEASPEPENICVFIDTNEARHSDWALQGVAEHELPDDQAYRMQLLETFDLVERVTGLRVVVLPHPRFTYPPEHFGRFEVRSGDTMGAVANARLVLGHYSTALAFAVIFNRPIVLMTSALFRNCMGGRIDRHIRAFAAEFGSRLISMDALREEDLQNWAAVDSGKYARYRANWIAHPDAPSGSMWQPAIRFVARCEGFEDAIRG